MRRYKMTVSFSKGSDEVMEFDIQECRIHNYLWLADLEMRKRMEEMENKDNIVSYVLEQVS